MGYKILGYAVWQGAKWYIKGRIDRRKKLAAAGFVGLAVVGLAAASSRRSG